MIRRNYKSKGILPFKWITLALCFSLSFSGCVNNKLSNQGSYRLETQKAARENIFKLKNGALLVRLAEKKRTLEALEKHGKIKQAQELRDEVKSQNKVIVSAFQEMYTFSKCYFFYSSESGKILSGEINKINFLDENLEIDDRIECNYENIFVSEFSELEQAEYTYVDGSRLEETSNGPQRVKTYGGGTDFKIAALVIRDENLVQLRRPFPYYVRSYRSKLFRKDPMKIVKKLNENLIEYAKR